MIRLYAFLCLTFAAVLLPAGADAQHCGTTYRARAVYHAPAYQAPVVHHAVNTVVIAAYVPLVAVPAYSIGYAPYVAPAPPPVQPVQPQGSDFKLLIDELKSMRLELNKLKNSPVLPPLQQQPPVQPPVQPPDQVGYLKIASQKCAACHDATTSKKGDGLVLLSAGQLVASPEQRLRMVSAIYRGTMPPGQKLSDDEAGLLVVGLTSSK